MEDIEYNFVKKNILTLTGVDLNGYKTPQMQRRLATYLQRSGHNNWRSYFDAIRLDRAAISKLKDYLTINVTSFFRDSEKFDYLRRSILPTLPQSRLAPLRIWSAGCSRGHEPYSLAIMLAEESGISRQNYILATDIDQSVLAWSRAGGPYATEELTNVSPSLLQRYFNIRDGRYYVNEALQRRVTFKSHNLLADPFEKGFDLIVCRNVVIYFTAEIKDQLYRRFSESLRPGGVLFVGGTEIVSKASEIGLETVGIGFYRRREVGITGTHDSPVMSARFGGR